MNRRFDTMKKYDRFFLICGIVMLISELWKQWCLTYIVNSGSYDFWYVPFQLCSLPMYICLVLPWIKPGCLKSLFLTFLMDFSLLGGIFVFFDTTGLHYDYVPLTVHSFAWHILLIAIGFTAGGSGDALYSWRKGFGGAVLVYAAGCVIATLLNLALHRYGSINMFYISPYYNMSQKFFRDIALSFGNKTGTLCYILASAAGAGIFHGIWKHICGNPSGGK